MRLPAFLLAIRPHWRRWVHEVRTQHRDVFWYGRSLYLWQTRVNRCSYVARYPVRWTTQSALHFTPPPEKPVHSDTNSASLESIPVRHVRRLITHISTTVQPLCTYCARTSQSQFHHCPLPGTHLYSQVNWGVVEGTKITKLRNGSNGDSKPGYLNWETAVYIAEPPRSIQQEFTDSNAWSTYFF